MVKRLAAMENSILWMLSTWWCSFFRRNGEFRPMPFFSLSHKLSRPSPSTSNFSALPFSMLNCSEWREQTRHLDPCSIPEKTVYWKRRCVFHLLTVYLWLGFKVERLCYKINALMRFVTWSGRNGISSSLPNVCSQTLGSPGGEDCEKLFLMFLAGLGYGYSRSVLVLIQTGEYLYGVLGPYPSPYTVLALLAWGIKMMEDEEGKVLEGEEAMT